LLAVVPTKVPKVDAPPRRSPGDDALLYQDAHERESEGHDLRIPTSVERLLAFHRVFMDQNQA